MTGARTTVIAGPRFAATMIVDVSKPGRQTRGIVAPIRTARTSAVAMTADGSRPAPAILLGDGPKGGGRVRIAPAATMATCRPGQRRARVPKPARRDAPFRRCRRPPRNPRS